MICKYKLQINNYEKINKRLDSLEARIEKLEDNQVKIHCNALGNGYVYRYFDSVESFLVKFENRDMPIMAIRDGSGFRLSTTENPKWHRITVSK